VIWLELPKSKPGEALDERAVKLAHDYTGIEVEFSSVLELNNLLHGPHSFIG